MAGLTGHTRPCLGPRRSVRGGDARTERDDRKTLTTNVGWECLVKVCFPLTPLSVFNAPSACNFEDVGNAEKIHWPNMYETVPKKVSKPHSASKERQQDTPSLCAEQGRKHQRKKKTLTVPLIGKE